MKSLELDPFRETADIDRNNNYFPPVIEATKFQLFKMRRNADDNPMKTAKAAEAKEATQLKAAQSVAEPAKGLDEKKEPATPAVKANPDAKPNAEVKPNDEPKKKKKKKKDKKKNKDQDKDNKDKK